MTSHEFRVEPGHVLAFARAVGDENLVAASPAVGTVVPTTFPSAAVQYDPKHMQGMRASGALADSPHDRGSVLHAEQHFEYSRPVRVGDQLTVEEFEGRRWRKESRRAGSLNFREVVKEYRDQSGEIVIRSRMVLVETEFAVSDGTGST
ncbi:hypothetical protein CBI38_34540 (plasmid) [Rhodococcus oxybenzonivorans]|uniref:FAS1-like dehydratase domain-containing protein n=1 Tax=Rhodococcus oxybenzonivorans TaxID=1990687 RepID=A0A2S2C6L5_9NOCA|nr:MaoC family dehydratase N-terminal domain-containing protein [Rhodococcus oxybenzonivorans]AWK76505.1 hypothetical protein CBI38_34540 [Rhodococcus oxybenzonivorans]